METNDNFMDDPPMIKRIYRILRGAQKDMKQTANLYRLEKPIE